MRRVCAWCERPLNDELKDETLISHGICGPCVEAAIGRTTSEATDSLAPGFDEGTKRTTSSCTQFGNQKN
jgi:hypothetical protein